MRVVLLPGDGIGPEVTAAARRVLGELAPDVELEEHLFGAAAIRATGDAAARRDARRLPRRRRRRSRARRRLPEFDAADVRPEQGLLRLRGGARRLREPAARARGRRSTC